MIVCPVMLTSQKVPASWVLITVQVQPVYHCCVAVVVIPAPLSIEPDAGIFSCRCGAGLMAVLINWWLS